MSISLRPTSSDGFATPSPMGSGYRRVLGAVTAVAALAAIPAGATAQEVGPPVAEYRGRAVGTFEVRNNGLYPMNVVIEPFGFTQDSVGAITYVPFDTTRVRLRLSTMSMRLPPRAAFTISYEAMADSAPAWFVITSTFQGPRREGVNYNFQFPHVIYLHQKASVRASDVRITDLSVDSAARQARFRIENASASMTRCGEGTLSSTAGTRSPIPAFPLFPRFARWVTVPWLHADPPTKLRLSCTGVDLAFDRPTLAAGGSP
jgi:hypothetical protein